MASKVQLAWAEVRGELRHVTDFDGTPPGKRPQAICPACGGELTMRLGSRVTHHYGHRPGAICALREGESAAHYNAKLWIAAELRRAQRERLASLTAQFPCTYIPNFRTGLGLSCKDTRTKLWIEGWDGVEVERSIGSRRPDVLVMRNGRPYAAIEVHVTHAVDEEKAAYLQELGIPWIEVTAEQILSTESGPWRVPLALPTCRISDPGDWLCTRHAEHVQAKERARIRQELQREARRQRREMENQERQRRREAAQRIRARLDSAERKEWKARVFDIYLSDGTYRRERWVMEAAIVADQVYAVELYRCHIPVPHARFLSAGRASREQCYRALDEAFQRHVDGERQYSGGQVAILTPWLPVARLSSADSHALPTHLSWNEASRRWVTARETTE